MTEYPGDLQEEMEISEGFFSLFGPWSEHIEELEQVIDGPVSLVRARTMNGSIVVRSGDPAGVTIRAWKIVRGPMEGLAEVFAERVGAHRTQHGETVAAVRSLPGTAVGVLRLSSATRSVYRAKWISTSIRTMAVSM
jgi:hypothetical protein